MSVQHVYQPKGLTLEQLLNTLQQQEGDKHWAAQELQLWLQRQQTPITAQTASPLLAQWRDELGYLCDQLTLPDLKQAWLQLYSPVVHSLKSVSLDTHTDAKRFACLVDHLIHRTMAMIADEASEAGLAQALRNCPEIWLAGWRDALDYLYANPDAYRIGYNKDQNETPLSQSMFVALELVRFVESWSAMTDPSATDLEAEESWFFLGRMHDSVPLLVMWAEIACKVDGRSSAVLQSLIEGLNRAAAIDIEDVQNIVPGSGREA